MPLDFALYSNISDAELQLNCWGILPPVCCFFFSFFSLDFLEGLCGLLTCPSIFAPLSLTLWCKNSHRNTAPMAKL